MQQQRKIQLAEQRVGLDWAIDILTPMTRSLVAQKKIPEDSVQRVEELQAIRATLEFLARPDVELRRRT